MLIPDGRDTSKPCGDPSKDVSPGHAAVDQIDPILLDQFSEQQDRPQRSCYVPDLPGLNQEALEAHLPNAIDQRAWSEKADERFKARPIVEFDYIEQHHLSSAQFCKRREVEDS